MPVHALHAEESFVVLRNGRQAHKRTTDYRADFFRKGNDFVPHFKPHERLLLLLSFLQPDAPYPAENELVGSLMKYLNEHLTESISLEEMARSFFISKYHLCHTFREHTGTSVISYLTTKRIALAQQHLEDGIPAIRVAELVGFRDYSVFYRAYRKIVGQSPSHAKGIGKRERRFGS